MHQQPYQARGEEYEFSDAENLIVASTGKRSSMWGLISIVTGVLCVVAAVVAYLLRAELAKEIDPNLVTIYIVALAPVGLINLSIASFYLGAGKALKAVVETAGNDVHHMLHALHKLANAFLAEVLVSIGVVLLAFTMGVLLALDATPGAAAEADAAVDEAVEETAEETAEEEGVEEAAEEAAEEEAVEEEVLPGEDAVPAVDTEAAPQAETDAPAEGDAPADGTDEEAGADDAPGE